ncbi:hypothetical protein MLD38_034732 [Melastoma candidum]|uniref:Uncharacterized protein n=1 Tax=Melastoma candidum TaxID=119954 RepID=A0ACB9MBE2_9MYRT|nr:hypothetical protein MLD38_034732 [Melastoma candidum]
MTMTAMMVFSPVVVVRGAIKTTPKRDDPCRFETPSYPSVPGGGNARGFPSFLPKEIEDIKDPFARRLARRIERVPVENESSGGFIMSSCVRPSVVQSSGHPVVLLHCFDSSCLEWRCAHPLLEEAGLEVWAVDVLGWGFSDLEMRPSCGVSTKRNHLYQFWKSHMRRPMVLVGPSLGASVAIDFAVNHPEAVAKLVLINASVYTEGLGNLSTLPEVVAYAGVSILRSLPLRLYANMMSFHEISFSTRYDWTNVGRLHCLLPWWKESMVSFMKSGGYNVVDQIKQVKHDVLIVYAEHDKIIPKKLQVRLHCELPKAIIRQVPDCGHLLHVEKPRAVTKLIAGFASGACVS